MTPRETIRAAVAAMLQGADTIPPMPVKLRQGKAIEGMITETLDALGMMLLVWPIRIVKAHRTGNFYFAENAELLIQCLEKPDLHKWDFSAYDAPDALAETLLGQNLDGLLSGAIEPAAQPESFFEGAKGRVVEMRYTLAFEAAVGRKFQQELAGVAAS